MEIEPPAKFNIRQVAWEVSKELIDPIVTLHGLSEYGINTAPFVLGSKITPTEQHIDHIIRVADWLLEP